MLVHAELLTFLNLCGSSVACSPPLPTAVPPVEWETRLRTVFSPGPVRSRAWAQVALHSLLTALSFTSHPKECS